jgi:hypothetical protein
MLLCLQQAGCTVQMKSSPARTGRTNMMRWTPSPCRTKPHPCVVAVAHRIDRGPRPEQAPQSPAADAAAAACALRLKTCRVLRTG